MPETVKTETLEANDAALTEMYQADTSAGELSPEDHKAFEELVDAQRNAYQEAATTKAEVKSASGEVREEAVKDIGDTALDAMVVHSDSWQTERK